MKHKKILSTSIQIPVNADGGGNDHNTQTYVIDGIELTGTNVFPKASRTPTCLQVAQVIFGVLLVSLLFGFISIGMNSDSEG